MSEIIAVSNQKGGVCKTSTVQNMGAGLTNLGKRVLMIDIDPQANLSFCMGIKGDDVYTVYDVLKKQKRADEVIIHTSQGDLLPSNILLAGAEMEFNHTGKEYMLKEAISDIKDGYDIIIIDTPPALGYLTVNAFTACDEIIIPIVADVFSLQGIMQLYNAVQQIKRYCNRDLAIKGILLTKCNPRLNLNKTINDMAENIAGQLGTKVFKTKIRESVLAREAQLNQEDIFAYTKDSALGQDYSDFITEYLEG